MTIHVHTFKWGNLYSAADVNRLRGMFLRNLTIPHKFHCSTDNPEGLRPDITVHKLQAFDCFGWDVGEARKVAVFQSDFLSLNGELVIQVDIDMVLVGNVNFLTDRPEEDFLIARGRNQASNARGHAAIYRLRIGSKVEVWERLVSDTAYAVSVAQHHRGAPGHISEQIWIDHTIPEMTFFEDGRVVYFRQDCNAYADHDNPAGVATLPEGARIVSFAGKIKPQHVMSGSYLNVRHAAFVEQHWRE